MYRSMLLRALWVASMASAVHAQNLLVSSSNNGRVLQYDWPTGALIGTFIPPGSGGLVQPFGLAYGPNTDLYVCSYDGDAILEYNGTTGAFVSTFIAAGGTLDQPTDVIWAPDGTVLVTSLTAGCVLRYSGGGTFLAASPCLGTGGVGTSLTFAPNGNLFVCWFRISPALAAVYEYTGPNHDVFVKSYGGGLGLPTAATIGPDGNLYVSDFPNDRVQRFSTITGGLLGTFVTAGSGGLDGPRDLTFGPNGNLFVLSNYTNSVLEYNGTTGAFVRVFVTSGSGGLSGPWGLVFQGAPPLTCADNCLDANPLTGAGVFPFDNTNATTDGPDHAACLSGGSPSIANDCWWCWTAPCSGRVVVRTCNETTVDTKIAVYAGCACPPTDANLLDCDDNGCGLQSLVTFFATAGSDYLIRIGTPPGSPGGMGAFRILCPPTGADFGDAPDGILSCQGEIAPPLCDMPAIYPTIYETTNAALNRTAPFHRPIGAEPLDDFYLGGAPSYEAGAYQACCDWKSCGIDAPPWAFPADDCPWVLCLNPPCTSGVLVIPDANCPPLAVHSPFGPYPGNPAWGYWIFQDTRVGNQGRPGFVNVAVDWDLSGSWGNVLMEWPMINRPVGAVTPEWQLTGFFPVITTYLVPPPRRGWGILPFWTRFMVSDEAVVAPLPNGLWDGSGMLGGYIGGETEDWVVEGDPDSGYEPPHDCFHSDGELTITLNPGDLLCQEARDILLSSAGQPPADVRQFLCGPYADNVTVLTELMQLQLQGFEAGVGPVIVRERADKLSLGLITQVVTDGSGHFVSGHSFFDVFVEVELPQVGMTLNTGEQPLRIDAGVIHQLPPLGSTYSSAPEQRVPLFLANSPQPMGWVCSARHTPTQPAVCSTPGDLNCDGLVDFDDINPFILALSDPAGYHAAYPNCSFSNGDCNHDGLVDFDDINPFVVILSGAG